ncbi:MAG: DUF2335 domain-containing protein [Spirochaetales bacterium]
MQKVPAGQLAFAASQNVRISPFPPPAEMQVYEHLAPGFTAEFLGTYKSQVEHRQKLETLAITGDNTRANRAQILSFILAIVFGILGFSLILLGRDVIGYATLLGAIGSLLLAFFGGTFMRYLERRGKARQSQ